MSSITPKTPRDFGKGFAFWAYCHNNMFCHHEMLLEDLDPDEPIKNIAARIECPSCGKKGALVHRIFSAQDDPAIEQNSRDA